MVIANLVGPQSKHTIKWNQNGKYIGDDEHGFCSKTKILLNVPKCESGNCGGDSLSKSKVGQLEEGERDDFVLDNGDESGGCV